MSTSATQIRWFLAGSKIIQKCWAVRVARCRWLECIDRIVEMMSIGLWWWIGDVLNVCNFRFQISYASTEIQWNENDDTDQAQRNNDSPCNASTTLTCRNKKKQFEEMINEAHSMKWQSILPLWSSWYCPLGVKQSAPMNPTRHTHPWAAWQTNWGDGHEQKSIQCFPKKPVKK